MSSEDFQTVGAQPAARHDPTYPKRAGFKAPGTSSEAAAAIDRDDARKQAFYDNAFILLLQNPDGLTRDEICRELDADPRYGWPRLTEMKAEGRIKESGFRRRNYTGRLAGILVAVTNPDPIPKSERVELEREADKIRAMNDPITEVCNRAIDAALSFCADQDTRDAEAVAELIAKFALEEIERAKRKRN